jgi:Transposase, Mutator family
MRCESAQNRPLDSVYPIIYVDCLVVKVRESQRVINKALYLALGVDMEGQKELLGMWIATSVRVPNSGCPSSPNYSIEASKTSSLLAWMDSQGSQKRLRPSIPKRACTCAWSTWCAIRSNMSPTNIARRWPLT